MTSKYFRLLPGNSEEIKYNCPSPVIVGNKKNFCYIKYRMLNHPRKNQDKYICLMNFTGKIIWQTLEIMI